MTSKVVLRMRSSWIESWYSDRVVIKLCIIVISVAAKRLLPYKFYILDSRRPRHSG